MLFTLPTKSHLKHLPQQSKSSLGLAACHPAAVKLSSNPAQSYMQETIFIATGSRLQHLIP